MDDKETRDIPQPPDETVGLSLILTKDGKLKVVGPVMVDKMAAYGLLELAKDAIRDAHRPVIIKPEHRLSDFLRGQNGKR